jgi:transcriptional regulator with GAF, ATPase, and Fis domain
VAGLEAGADDYLVKPFAASELLARVQAHVALARLRQEAHDALAAERDRLQAEVAARTQAEEALRHSHEHLRLALARLQRLQAVSDAALSQLALPALLRQVLEHITTTLEVDNTALLLLDETEDTLIVHHALGPEAAQTGQVRVPVGQGVAGRIAATRQPLIVANLRTLEPVNSPQRAPRVSSCSTHAVNCVRSPS